MSTRRTTRSTKQPAPTITDHFLQSRITGSELPGKSIGEDAPTTASSAKRSLFSASRVQVIPNEVELKTLPVHTKEPVTKSPARAMFGVVPKKEVKKVIVEPVKEEVVEKVVVRSMIPTEADIVEPKASGTRKLRATDLQEELAKKGAGKIHEQINARKLTQIAEREAHLKSPQKMAQTRITAGASPPKRAKKESKKRGPAKVLSTPDFVLPTPSKSLEKGKVRSARERSEGRESSPQEDSILSVPRGYGSSLMNDEVKKAVRVKIPPKYEELLEAFKKCEAVVSLLEASGKMITFSMLANAVKSQTRKEFSLDRFAQLLAVYPNSYRVQVKKLTWVGDGGVRSAQWEHVIRPILDGDLTSFVTGPLISEQPLLSEPILTNSPRKGLFTPKGRPITSSAGIRIPASSRKPGSPAKPLQREAVMDSCPKLQGWRIPCRHQVFRCLLARRVIAAHDEYIDGLQLDPSLLLPSSPSLPPAFHEDFTRKMDSLCPPIEKAPMETIPEEENVAGNSHLGMGDLIKMASATVTLLPNAAETALLEVLSPERKADSPRQMSLLERIKARTAAGAAAAMRRNPELEEKMADLRRLIDNKNLELIFDIYRSISRTSVDTTIMAEQMAASSTRIVKDLVPPLLTRLCSLAPAHFSITSTSQGKFMRVSPDNSPATYTAVESILKKEMEVCQSKSATAHSLRAR